MERIALVAQDEKKSDRSKLHDYLSSEGRYVATPMRLQGLLHHWRPRRSNFQAKTREHQQHQTESVPREFGLATYPLFAAGVQNRWSRTYVSWWRSLALVTCIASGSGSASSSTLSTFYVQMFWTPDSCVHVALITRDTGKSVSLLYWLTEPQSWSSNCQTFNAFGQCLRCLTTVPIELENIESCTEFLSV